MGQQQLLLLVLGAIIVGAAILIGINMFSASAYQANEDAVRQDCLTIASRLQEYWRKPTTLGGGGHTFLNVTFQDIGLDSTASGATTYENEHGKYVFGTILANSVEIEGTTKEKNAAGKSLIITYTLDPYRVNLTDETPEP